MNIELNVNVMTEGEVLLDHEAYLVKDELQVIVKDESIVTTIQDINGVRLDYTLDEGLVTLKLPTIAGEHIEKFEGYLTEQTSMQEKIMDMTRPQKYELMCFLQANLLDVERIPF